MYAIKFASHKLYLFCHLLSIKACIKSMHIVEITLPLHAKGKPQINRKNHDKDTNFIMKKNRSYNKVKSLG